MFPRLYNQNFFGTNSEISVLQNELNNLKKQMNDENEEPEISVNKVNNNSGGAAAPFYPPPIDPVVNYDRMKLTDPFIDPSQRTSLDQIPGPYFAPYINFPSRGIVELNVKFLQSESLQT